MSEKANDISRDNTPEREEASRAIAGIRREYEGKSLDRQELKADPFEQFREWFDEARNSEEDDVNGMTLATATPEGIPSARIVLLKGIDDGFLFYTNYESRKGNELAANPNAALVFWWKSLNRQVRIEGIVERVDADNSDAYFNSRPVGSRISAIASPQSQTIGDREELEQRVADIEEKCENQEKIERPDYWGGYRLRPRAIEFWQGRNDRLHDRFRYQREMDGKGVTVDQNRWKIERLAP